MLPQRVSINQLQNGVLNAHVFVKHAAICISRPCKNLQNRMEISCRNPGSSSQVRLFTTTQHCRCDNKEPDEDKKKKRVIKYWYDFSYKYTYRFYFANSKEPKVLHYMGGSQLRFLGNAACTFQKVSDWIVDKDYKSLSQIVTPNLLTRIETNDGLYNESFEDNVFKVQTIPYAAARDVSLNIDINTGVRTVEILFAFACISEEVPFPLTFMQILDFVIRGKISGSQVKMADYRFVKEFGGSEEEKPWLIKDMYYRPFHGVLQKREYRDI